jgi:hypothetical protein
MPSEIRGMWIIDASRLPAQSKNGIYSLRKKRLGETKTEMESPVVCLTSVRGI